MDSINTIESIDPVNPVVEIDNEVIINDADETTSDGNNLSLLNSTKQNLKRTLISIEKTGSVKDDIAEGKFTKEKLFNKRSAKQKLLPIEIFDPPEEPVFKQNKTGFLTERPLEWMVAMEKYVSVEKDVKARWVYKTDEDGTIYECEISTWFHTTTEVTVVIVVSTGVFTVQGQHCRKFAETEFIKIRDHMEGCKVLPPTEPMKKSDLDGTTDLEGMWKNIDSNKNALLSVQESVVKLLMNE